jgi:hypothetical protein
VKHSSSTVTRLLLVLLVPAMVGAQGLGDAAKKEQAKRKQTPQQSSKARTYTEDELRTLPPIANAGEDSDAAAAPAAVAETGSAPAGSGGDPGERLRKQDERMWRSRVATANRRLAAAQKAYQTLSGMTLVPGYVYVDQNGRTVIHSVEQLQSMTARAKANLDAAQKALDDLLEEARRANVPPGWLR